jgi:RNA polymerase sigma-70 factor (ECF subfamily)
VARTQERRVLDSILLSMDVDLRTVLVMHELFGHTAPEIAAALAIPMNTVYSRLRLARGDFDSRVRRRRVQP